MSKIIIPQKNQETSMGRRLFAMAAPIVGGAMGGPAGAVAGSVIGGKMAGASTQDAVMSGVEAGAGAMNRRASAASQEPQAQINEGLNVLSELPQDHQLRKDLTAPLVKAQFAAKGMKV